MTRQERRIAAHVEARLWLRGVLKNGPVETERLRDLARTAGISTTELCRARRGLADEVSDFGQIAWELKTA